MRRVPPLRRLTRSKAFFFLTASLFGGGWRLVRLLGAKRGPRLAARLVRLASPVLGESRIAKANIAAAFPEKSEQECAAILAGAWDNFIRTTCEMPVLDRIVDAMGRIDVVGREFFEEAASDGLPAVMFTAHLGNWELLAALAARHGTPLTALYRAPSNPYIAARVLRERASVMGPLIANSRNVSRVLVRAIKDGAHLGLLMDQRPRGGLPVTFLGRPARANELVGTLASMFDCPVLAGRCIRLPDDRFRIEITRINPPRNAEGGVDADETTRLVNATIEAWIREHPEQWLWLHDRWRN